MGFDEIGTIEHVVEMVLFEMKSVDVHQLIDQLEAQLEDEEETFSMQYDLGAWFIGAVKENDINILSLLHELADTKADEEREEMAEDELVKDAKRLWNRKGF
jgi:hypothetical protein